MDDGSRIIVLEPPFASAIVAGEKTAPRVEDKPVAESVTARLNALVTVVLIATVVPRPGVSVIVEGTLRANVLTLTDGAL